MLPNLCSFTSKISALFLEDRRKFFESDLCSCLIKPNVINDFVTNHPQYPPKFEVDSILLNTNYLFLIMRI